MPNETPLVVVLSYALSHFEWNKSRKRTVGACTKTTIPGPSLEFCEKRRIGLLTPRQGPRHLAESSHDCVDGAYSGLFSGRGEPKPAIPLLDLKP